MVITRIGAWSLGRIYGAISAAFGLLLGLVFAAAALIGSGLGANDDIPAGLGGLLGVGAVIFLPLFYGVAGLLLGALAAALYNFFAGMVGGVKIDVT